MAKRTNIDCGKEGAIGEMLVTVDLMRKGFDVFRAISPSCPCDLIALRGIQMVRVEVTKGRRTGIDGKKLRWCYHNPARYDLLAVWETDGTINYDPIRS